MITALLAQYLAPPQVSFPNLPMLFHSHLFVFGFFPVVLIVYYALARWDTYRSVRMRLWSLIAASLIFYGYWDIRLIPLLVGSVSANWLFARLFALASPGTRRRFLVSGGVALNLAVLAIFKYADFFGGIVASIGGWSAPGWSIILPLGISFFTFQQIAYLIDLKRGTAPVYRFSDYMLFVTFFPQLIAGPIVRHDEIIPQYRLSPLRDGLHERLSRGFALFVAGMVAKAFFADRMAMIADPLYKLAESGRALSAADGWVAAVAFGLQIFFDFAGYSIMAIGLALMMGFRLPANFNLPYRATSIRDFWRRWHMTLSRFLRDYLYIPLGGSRHGWQRRMIAIMVTMLLGGLWHGAGWNFVLWGGLHGVALVINHAWQRMSLRMPAPGGWLMTMLFVFVCWVFFRAETFAGSSQILQAMVGLTDATTVMTKTKSFWYMAAACLVSVIGLTHQRFYLEWLRPSHAFAALIVGAFVFITLHVGGVGEAEFIYFQF